MLLSYIIITSILVINYIFLAVMIGMILKAAKKLMDKFMVCKIIIKLHKNLEGIL